jgi:predicted O-linked N-acetylglucosamine transferase (SPINDLY family)
MNTTDRNDPCPCGSTKKYKHCCQRKKNPSTTKNKPNMPMVSVWLQLAMENLRSERLSQAAVFYKQVLQVNPNQAEALQWLGLILHKQGDSERAIEHINLAITQNPLNAVSHITLASVFKDLGQLDAAIDSYGKALSLKHDLAEVHNNIGTVYVLKGKLDEAQTSFQTAISVSPAFAEAHNNLGIVFSSQGKHDDAVACFQRAIALAPGYAKAQTNLSLELSAAGGTDEPNDVDEMLHAMRQVSENELYYMAVALRMEGKPERAIETFRQATVLDPHRYENWLALGNALQSQGMVVEARDCLQRCNALSPKPGIRVRSDLMLPIIMGTQPNVNQTRQRLERNLQQLIDDQIKMDDPYAEQCVTNFHLAYHGLNDKEIQIKIADFYAQACPSLLYVAPHCNRPRGGTQKKRIGFLSEYIAKHSVASSYSHIVNMLADQGEYEVVLLSHGDATDAAIRQTYPKFKGLFTRLPLDLQKAREMIAALELDVLVYLDIGMGPFSYFLAYSRLARTQCVTGGHPVTTGIGAVDYFLSSDLAETTNADSHYSEKLVRLPFGMFYFARPTLPEVFKTRNELGLPPDGTVYLCPLMLHKLHPDFDEAMARILQLDPRGHVVLIADQIYSKWQELLEDRLKETVPQSVRSRIVFLPWVTDPMDFISLTKAADVVLDSFHFGLGTTAIASCSVGTPFVTKPSEFMRGRVGLFYAKILDVMEHCVAQSCEDYAQKAVAIANNIELRSRLQSKILTDNHILFENEQGVIDTVAWLRQA